MIYLTSDWHLFHEKLAIKRGYSCAAYMHDDIIANTNSKVKANDVLYIIGDLAMTNDQKKVEDVMSKVVCKNIILILGNHDLKNKKICRIQQLSAVHDYIELQYNGMHFVLCHYPFATWNRSHYGSMNIHGHSHGSYPSSNQQLDVGLDTNNMNIYSIDEAIEKMKSLPSYKIKHHDKPSSLSC